MILLTWLIDYQIDGLNPKVFHAINIVWHIATSILVFFFFQRFTGSKWISLILSMLFAVHPMHVETVAWVTGRKDLVYSFFFLSSLVTYDKYLTSKNSLWYWITLVIFTISVLAKAVAVVVPIILLVMDFLIYKRKVFWKPLFEKAPMFFISLAIGLLAIYGQQETGAVQEVSDFSFLVTPFIACYGLIFYFVRFFVPFGMSAYHPYPFMNNEDAPMEVYLSAFPVLAVVILAIIFFRKNGTVMFGLLFFFLCHLPTLQLVPIGSCIVAERYTYLSYIGLSLAVALPVSSWLKQRTKSFQQSTILFLVVYMLSLSAIANTQVKTWNNSKTLWHNAEKLYPNDFVVCDNLGLLYSYENKLDTALSYFNKEIAANPYADNAFNNRGHLLMQLNAYQQALPDFNRAIELNPDYALAWMNRGVTLLNLGQFQSAITNLETAVKHDSSSALTVFNLGLAYELNGQIEKSMKTYDLALKMDSAQVEFYYRRARLKGLTFKLDESLNDIEKGLQLNSDHLKLLTLRSEIKYSMKLYQEALDDAYLVKQKGGIIDPDYLNRLIVLSKGESNEP
jgi:tetratricopeptide (TPR) repeat protein